ncbi:MAG: SirB1 family protein [Bdellovibrionales bacterium]
MTETPQAFVDRLSDLQDEEIDLGYAALMLAAFDQPGVSIERYVHHLYTLAEDVGSRYLALLKSGADESVETRLAALKHVISDQHAYIGDKSRYDDLENMSLIRVIERAKGIPITLSILYIAAGRAQGWDIYGLHIPGHFVCRLDSGSARLIFDPFENCKLLEASDLRLLVKRALGERAELSSHYFEPCSNRDILIRLQNNIKHRLIEDEDYAGALTVIERMRKIDPQEFRLLFDAGVLYARVEQTRAAIDALEAYLARVPNDPARFGDRHDALLLLAELKGRLN